MMPHDREWQGLWTLALSRLMGKIRSPTQANQPKQNEPQKHTNKQPQNKSAHQRDETRVSSETSAGLRLSLRCTGIIRITWPGRLETWLEHPAGEQAATAACHTKAHMEDPVVSQLQNCPFGNTSAALSMR